MRDDYLDLLVNKFMGIKEALSYLPGIKPAISRKVIKVAGEPKYSANGMISSPTYLIGKTQLTKDEYKELWIERPWLDDKVRISPKGAKILLALYYNGDLIMDKGMVPVKVTALDAYSKSKGILENNMKISITLTEKEQKLVESFAQSHSMSMEEAIRFALFEQIEDELDIADAEKAYQKYVNGGKKSNSIEELWKNLGI